jgi:hypothetical protein
MQSKLNGKTLCNIRRNSRRRILPETCTINVSCKYSLEKGILYVSSEHSSYATDSRTPKHVGRSFCKHLAPHLASTLREIIRLRTDTGRHSTFSRNLHRSSWTTRTYAEKIQHILSTSL